MTNLVSLYFSKHNKNHAEGEREFWVQRGRDYVRRLYAGLDRHMPKCELYRKILITDTPEVAPPGVYTKPLPTTLDIAPGWWMKLALFSGIIHGRTLYLDLDNVVCGDLMPLLRLEPDPLIMLDDGVHPRLPNGSMYYCYPERLRARWDDYLKDPEGIRARFSRWPNASDQAFVAGGTRHIFAQDYLPAGSILNARVDLAPGADTSRCMLVVGGADAKPHTSTHPLIVANWKE